MSRHSPVLKAVRSAPSMRGGAQMSRPRGFAHRVVAGGRYAAGAARPELTREVFLAWWAGLVGRRCGSAHDIAMRFDCTEQTGRNWIDGASCPTGLQVMRAQGWWPEEFAAARMARSVAGASRRAVAA